ncbi:MAG: cation diffusion facilitator family transporter [Ghiorsea sp.]|nr:cation diffusion facilitator family transporter [Ghiorsea sp.]
MTHEGHNHVNDNHTGHHHGLGAAMWLTAAFMVVELVGGYMANSLALMADAGHMASDVAALGLALVAQRIAARPAHAGMTYGYGRVKVLAAQVNGLTLWLLSAWIVWEAMSRLAHPPAVQGSMVLIIASIGLVINLVVMRWLHGSHDLNTRAAYWHVLGDALGSVAAIIAGAVIMLTGWMPIDPILSFFVAIVLAWGGWRLLRDTTLELMEASPRHIDLDNVQQFMLQTEGVIGVHHIHIWRLPNRKYAASAHIQLQSMQDWPKQLRILRDVLKTFEIEHATLQPELGCCEDGEHKHC